MEQEIFRGKIFRLVLEEIAPGLTYERVYQRDGITVFPLPAEGHVRLIRKTTTENTKVRIRPVTGYVEDNEDPLDCAERELGEELGLEAATWIPFLTTSGEGGLKKSQYFFVAKELRLLTVPLSIDVYEQMLEAVDLSYAEVQPRTLAGEFGTGSNAFALLKLITTHL